MSSRIVSRRRALRAAVVAVLVVAGSLAWLPSASGESKPIPIAPSGQAWYWSSNKEVRQCIGTDDQGLCPVTDGSSASPVEPGHLAVGLQLGSSDMRSYVRTGFSDLEGVEIVPFGSTLSSVVLTLPVSRADATDTEHAEHHTGPGAKPPATQNEERASITACAVKVEWGNAEAAPPYSMNKKDPTKTDPAEPFVKPEGYDCNAFSAPGKRGAKAWTFDLTRIARQWFDGTVENYGVVLLPNRTSDTDSWRVEFHGAAITVANDDAEQVYVSAKEAGSFRATFTPPVEPPPPPPPPPIDTGGGGTVVPPPAPTDPVIAPPPPPPAPTAEPEPQPESEPVAQPRPETPWYAWLVLPFGAGAFVLFSRALGREAGAAGANRVAEVLRRRRAEALATGD